MAHPVPGAPSDNTSLVEVLANLAGRGYDTDFLLRPDAVLECGSCHSRVAAPDVGLDELRRLEGASDPDDMVAVLALTCPVCGARGTAIARFGPQAPEADDDLLHALRDVRPS